ncbi:hypothetical protein H4R99_007548, partial [Coemansia sp. RSA 1722]
MNQTTVDIFDEANQLDDTMEALQIVSDNDSSSADKELDIRRHRLLHQIKYDGVTVALGDVLEMIGVKDSFSLFKKHTKAVFSSRVKSLLVFYSGKLMANRYNLLSKRNITGRQLEY